MMDRALFSPEHDLFRTTVRRFVAEELVPHHAAWEEAGIVSRAVWQSAGAAGLLCADVDAAYGGAGADFLFNVVIIEELASAGITGPGFIIHSEMVAPYIVGFGTEEQKCKWLPPMVCGEMIGAVAMTEPSAGSDLKAIRTRAVRQGDEYVINGQKVYISNGQLANIAIVACKTDPAAGARGISLIAVETDRPGFRRGRNLKKIGVRAQDTSEIFFDDVRVPCTNLLGEEGRGFSMLMTKLARERLCQAVRSVAAAEAAIQWTIEYTSERKAFNQTIGDFKIRASNWRSWPLEPRPGDPLWITASAGFYAISSIAWMRPWPSCLRRICTVTSSTNACNSLAATATCSTIRLHEPTSTRGSPESRAGRRKS